MNPLPQMPERIARLPRDKRGYPIPWNVLRNDAGDAFFTVNDDRKALRALQGGLCGLCGEGLGRWRWLVGGVRSAFDPHGAYLDLPGHRDCMEFALQACPYLAAPKYLGRIDVVNPEKLPPEAQVLLDETQIPERPELFVAVAAPRIELLPREHPALAPHLRPVRPYLDFTFWRHGRQLSDTEALPFLQAALGADWTPPARA